LGTNNKRSKDTERSVRRKKIKEGKNEENKERNPSKFDVKENLEIGY
jgi:hypothetical protein